MKNHFNKNKRLRCAVLICFSHQQPDCPQQCTHRVTEQLCAQVWSTNLTFLVQTDVLYFLIYHFISKKNVIMEVAKAICQFKLNSAKCFSHAKHEHESWT